MDGDCLPLSYTDRHRVADYYGCAFANAHGYRHPGADCNTFPDGKSDSHAGADAGRRRADPPGADLDVSLRLGAGGWR